MDETVFGQHLLLVLVLALVLANTSPVDAAEPAGDLAADLASWTATLERREAPLSERVEALIRRGETYRGLGRWDEAEADLRLALEQARAIHADLLQGVASYALGQLYAEVQRGSAAEPLLRSALAQAERLDRPILGGAAANSLAVELARTGRTLEARAQYARALGLAQESGDRGLTAAVRRNLARLALETGRGHAAALPELKAARKAARAVAAPGERAELLLGIGTEALEAAAAGRALGVETLHEAATAAQRAGLSRVQAEALGKLGGLHEASGQFPTALALSEKAVQIAPKDAHDLLYSWEWRIGRLYRARNNREQAIAAYRRAVDHLERIRQFIPVDYSSGRSSFRETFGPLYLQLSDLLLQRAAAGPGGEREQALLLEAQARVEQIKLDELRDYLRDACLQPLRRGAETVAPGTAVLYPIIFPKRLELLARVGERMYRFTTPVDATELAHAASRLRDALVAHQRVPDASQSLYDWLIAPIAATLATHSVTTLAVVPDGVLRTIPFAALSDRGRYLIEQFALVTLPGLTLIDPKALPRAGQPALLAGLSRPGPVIAELPEWWIDALVKQYRSQETDKGGTNQRGAVVDSYGADRRGFTPSVTPGAVGSAGVVTPDVVEALSLPGVRAELAEIAGMMPSETLMDEAFRLDRFVTELGEKSFRVVHIASHGLFGGSPEENFIVTYDKQLDMGTLSEMLRPKQLSEAPVELLVLSACQTAEGDDRTPLGLAGIALQSGARGSIGSLWPVDDAATQALMRRFYDGLRDPGTTKGQALRQAQVELLHTPAWRHPYYWAPFILVGNWL